MFPGFGPIITKREATDVTGIDAFQRTQIKEVWNGPDRFEGKAHVS
jgi:hypothetical protein